MGLDLVLALAFSAVARDAVEIPFLYHRGTILFDASIRDRSVLCLLDTGAEASAVDERLAVELALEAAGTVTVVGTAGSREVVSYAIPALTVRALRVENLRATGFDLDPLLAPDGARVEAIVGFDFLGGCALEIDFDARMLVFERPASGPVETEPRGIPMRLDRGVPRVPALLDGVVHADFRIDTGASLFDSDEVYVNVTTDVWTRLRAVDPGLRPHGFFGNNLLEKHGRVRIDYPARRLLLGSGTRREPEAGSR